MSHLSPIFMYCRINLLYSHLDVGPRHAIKSNLLGLLASEPVKVVRVAIAGVVAALSKNVLSTEGSWNDLFNMLTQLLKDSNVMSREVCFSLLAQVRMIHYHINILNEIKIIFSLR